MDLREVVAGNEGVMLDFVLCRSDIAYISGKIEVSDKFDKDMR